jgi:hypothetical protein
MGDLIACCSMDTYDDAALGSDCPTTMDKAKSCASSQGCIDSCVQQTATQYLQCVQSKKVDGTCPFAAFCMGTLFNDPQLDASGNPVLGTNSLDFGDILGTAAAQSISSGTCSAFEPFVSKVCELGGNCCSACDAQLGALTNCLVNNFVLPLYKLESGVSDSTLQCPVSGVPCGFSSTATGRGGALRQLAEDEAVDVEGSGSFVNITDCEQSMSIDWVVHNESYAAGEFFNCIGEKMVSIIAEEDESVNDQESSSARTTVTLLGVASSVAFFFASFL